MIYSSVLLYGFEHVKNWEGERGRKANHELGKFLYLIGIVFSYSRISGLCCAFGNYNLFIHLAWFLFGSLFLLFPVRGGGCT